MSRIIFCLLALIGLIAGSICAASQSCCDPCLRACHWRLTFRGGISPTWYTDRELNVLMSEDAPLGLAGTNRSRRFDQLFELPWTVGGSIGYLFRDCLEIFLDGEYTRADGKQIFFTLGEDESVTIFFNRYEAWSLSVGSRYYLNQRFLCRRAFTPFIGMKIGFKNHMRVDVDRIADPGPTDIGRGFYSNHYVPSWAVQGGVNWSICSRLAIVGMVELVYSGQLKGQRVVVNGSNDFAQTASVGSSGPVFSVPITLGVAWTI